MAQDDLAARRRVQLHTGPREAIGPAIDMLGRWFDLNGVVIGGETALEARWHHRRSTDLDLFAPVPYLSNLMTAPRDRIERDLQDRAEPTRRVDASVGAATQLRAAQVFRYPHRSLDIGKTRAR